MSNSIKLYPHQLKALKNMKNGCILCGGVGSGKSRTALAYFFKLCGGELKPYSKMTNPLNLYIITTARKRDELEWDGDMAPFRITTHDSCKLYSHLVVVDSWNNIKKYQDVENSFFIFDEQRVVGNGAWVKSFLKITKKNQWILLSATPGDTWQDYIPVFIANGFYKNRTEFIRDHVVYKRFSKFPQVDRYLNVGRLVRYRHQILVTMDFDRKTVAHHENVFVEYDKESYKQIVKERWDIWNDKPIANAASLCYSLRKVVNEDPSRVDALLRILKQHDKVIVFYNHDYELKLLRSTLDRCKIVYSEWNGHKHDPIPSGKTWVYLVQYAAGAEGWNCVETNTIVFYSQNYSYKILKQSSGRIDRLNTPYSDLYYYHLKSRSGIDLAISKALKSKKKFNESMFVKGVHL